MLPYKLAESNFLHQLSAEGVELISWCACRARAMQPRQSELSLQSHEIRGTSFQLAPSKLYIRRRTYSFARTAVLWHRRSAKSTTHHHKILEVLFGGLILSTRQCSAHQDSKREGKKNLCGEMRTFCTGRSGGGKERVLANDCHHHRPFVAAIKTRTPRFKVQPQRYGVVNFIAYH